MGSRVQFLESQSVAGHQAENEPFLFSMPEHLALQGERWLTYRSVDAVKKNELIRFSVSADKDVARSPVKGPFAALEIATDVSAELIYRFFLFVEKSLRKRGINRIILKHQHDQYRNRQAPKLHACLFSLGYEVLEAEVGAVVQVDSESLWTKMDSWEKRRKRQATASSLTAVHLPLTELRKVYNFLKGCREERGHELSLSWQEVYRLAKTFPDRILLVSITSGKRWAAASLAIRVRSDILYNFYTGHLAEFNRLSPTVSLLDHLNAYCYRNKIALLDLGTSSVRGVPNFSLLQFKLRMGSTPTLKLSVSKML